MDKKKLEELKKQIEEAIVEKENPASLDDILKVLKSIKKKVDEQRTIVVPVQPYIPIRPYVERTYPWHKPWSITSNSTGKCEDANY